MDAPIAVTRGPYLPASSAPIIPRARATLMQRALAFSRESTLGLFRYGPVASASLGIALALMPIGRLRAQGVASNSTTSEWEVEAGFRLDTAARGFRLPTAIAFVPSPGPRPADPRFFVAELHGTLKVVTNDGSVHTFAEDFVRFTAPYAVPLPGAEMGMAGLCLDPRSGSVIVTYVYRDSTGALRNGMTRFETSPGVFSVTPSRKVSMDSLFATDRSAESHQIGPCQIMEGHLMVAVGNAFQSAAPRLLPSTLGKVLRMTIDGAAPADNPFSKRENIGATRFVWAYGLRNVFGLKVVGRHLFASENGGGIDRFFELEAGRDYLYDGTDAAIGLNAPVVFFPAVSPVQLDYVPPSFDAFPPEFRGRFVLALAGRAGGLGPGLAGDRSIVAIDYDLERRQVRTAPRQIVRYAGEGIGGVVAMGLGSDGLYFAAIFPGPDSTSAILRLSYSSDRPHSRIIGANITATDLLRIRGCLACHQYAGTGSKLAPSLDDPPLRGRLETQLASPAYLSAWANPDSQRREPYTSLAPRRQEVLDAPPPQQPRVWLINWLLDPHFAKPAPAMPNLGLSRRDAEALAELLLAGVDLRAQRVPEETSVLPPSRHRYTAIAFGLGAALAMLAMGAMRRLRSGGA